MAYYAKNGIRCVGYDIVPETVRSINAGEITLAGLGQWLGFSAVPLVKNGLMHATSKVKDIIDDSSTKVHFIAVPTERNGKPWDGALFDVSKKLSAKRVEGGPDLIMVESTLAPGQCDNVLVDTLRKAGRQVPRDFLVAVAPRRDWFDNPGLNLNTIPRVVGGIDEESTKEATGVASIVCSKIVPVSSHRVAELVKSTENSFRALNIAFANALSRAYPDVNVNELINAAATKWNYLAHYPGIGTGGYCIPLAPQYLVAGATNKGNQLDFLAMINTINESQTAFVGETISKNLARSSIGILGLSSKRNLKVHVLSPTLDMAKNLKAHKKEVYIHDPFYSASEIKSIAGTESFEFPRDRSKFDSIVWAGSHFLFADGPGPKRLKSIKEGTPIVGGEGKWESYRHFFMENGIDYRKIGDAGWAAIRKN